MKPPFDLRPALPVLFSAVLLFQGCVIFSPVGHAISTQYENTVSYFNAYYNASRLFSDAEEEIRTAQLAARGKEAQYGNIAPIPSTARQKLNLVIDKCSNILAFHPEGTLVDDALFLIGKSFFYQADYVRAERKFTEMLVRYPNSNLALEAQMWLASTFEKLNKSDEALESSRLVMAAAEQQGEDDLDLSARMEAARVYRKKEDDDKALAMLQEALAHAGSDEDRARIHTFQGDILVEQGQDSAAAEVYLTASNEATDLYDRYYARLHAATANRDAGRYDDAQRILEEMREDFRFKDYRGSISYELGRTLAAAGKTADAVEIYRQVDTSYARTNYGSLASYDLARLYERTLRDYPQARIFYARAAAYPTPATFQDARRKSASFERYFTDQLRLRQIDSLTQVLADTGRVAPPDTARASLADSLRPKVNVPPPPFPLQADSLRLARSRTEQELGDIFYSEIEVPDSAVFWYTRSMQDAVDSLRTPRILYILGEIARTYPDRGYVSMEERYRELLTQYPMSEYALAIRRARGELVDGSRADSAAARYRSAEQLIDADRSEDAVTALKALVQAYPTSPVAGRSAYAIAWLYEFRLNSPDSAIAWYRTILKSQVNTPYAVVARVKVGSIPTAADSAAADSSRAKPVDDDRIESRRPPGAIERGTRPPTTREPNPDAKPAENAVEKKREEKD